MIVINHTLLFMLLGGPEEQEERESGYLFPNDFIIFDEAHTLEQIASRQIGIGVSQYGLRATVQRLYNARTRKGLFHRHARCRRRDPGRCRWSTRSIAFSRRSTSAAIFGKDAKSESAKPDFVPDTISAPLDRPAGARSSRS